MFGHSCIIPNRIRRMIGHMRGHMIWSWLSCCHMDGWLYVCHIMVRLLYLYIYDCTYLVGLLAILQTNCHIHIATSDVWLYVYNYQDASNLTRCSYIYITIAYV